MGGCLGELTLPCVDLLFMFMWVGGVYIWVMGGWEVCVCGLVCMRMCMWVECACGWMGVHVSWGGRGAGAGGV